MKIRIFSLGCRLNRSEIESIATSLIERGHLITRDGDADLHIINSCVVTGRSEQKTRQLVRRAVSEAGARPDARVIVAGCGAGELRREGNVFYVPNKCKSLIPEIVDETEDIERLVIPTDAAFRYVTPVRSSISRANMKIQDGCDNNCSYCIVPLVRGAPKSREADRIVDECRRLVDAGYREIVLTGVMIGSYRSGGADLAGLMERLLPIGGRFRLHLSSITPSCVTPGLIRLLGHDRMVKHLHLSLQSGSDAVLARMNRPYTGADFLALAGRVRDEVPDINLTTDVIVGFPGETDDDFQATLEVIAAAGLSHVHTFRYSPRPGTGAAAMGDTVPASVKARRSREVIALSARQKGDYYRRFDGRISTLMSERTRAGRTTGFNEFYVPVEVEGRLPGREFFTVRTEFKPGASALQGSLL